MFARRNALFFCFSVSIFLFSLASRARAVEPPEPVFNREPLVAKPYTELALGAVEPEGWLLDELQRMSRGMSGNLDAWYPEVCGPRNAWLGGDGDTWERGPYWIDGLYPLAVLLDDPALRAKAMVWIDYTINHQRPDGQIGPVEIKPSERTRPAPAGAQLEKPDDWWPRMVMLKILQQHYMATGDPRALECLIKYFRYQLQELPSRPLHDPSNPNSGSWWAAQRGGDNLLVVLWLYNVTGESWLLDLADIIHKQTVPVTDWFSPGAQNMILRRADQGDALHCVNVAQMVKTPIVRWQQDQQAQHLAATAQALRDIRTFHGQPHGLYGGDEPMHGDTLDRGSELCSAVEMMFSLEKMFEITGDVSLADYLERVAFNALPTQCTDDHFARQYFQQSNQVQVTMGDRDFYNDGGDRLVYGLLQGYPCCTCNLHQGWPKLTHHAWMASHDGGLAVVSYLPTRVTASIGDDAKVSVRLTGGYPFRGDVRLQITTSSAITFPLHLRIPAWAEETSIRVNGEEQSRPIKSGSMHVLRREWKDGDQVELRFPLKLRTSSWYARSRAIERGPLVFALDIEPEWTETELPRPDDVSMAAMHRGYREARPKSAWNYALTASAANQPDRTIVVEEAKEIPLNPWTRDASPVRLKARAVLLPDWGMNRLSAAMPPLSPRDFPQDADPQEITLLPYGATTLRIAAFPWVRGDRPPRQARSYQPHELRFSSVTASHTFAGDTVDAVRMPHEPSGSFDTSIPRWTSWPQTGAPQWLEVSLDEPILVREVSVYWYDDDQGIDLPKAWRVEVPRDGGWVRLDAQNSAPPKVAPDTYNKLTFLPVTTQRLRIVMEPGRTDKCLGVLSVKVE